MILPKSQVCAWNHHHQHTPTFRYTFANRILEFFYALHTGVTTNLWVLHHVHGHHNNFLDQSKDESRWTRDDGTQMGELEYSLKITATAYYRGYQVGKQHPKEQKNFILYSLITFAIVAGLVAYKPTASLLLFVLPMIMGLFMTAWATYEHHAGLNTDNQFEASFNNLNRWYNLFTGNLGYHTAHHYRQGLHWSKLPQLHEKIKDNIPEELVRKSWV
jgi:fatty acid desaturase